MPTAEKISVIIPCYNNEKYIEKCIDSVIEQDYKNLEILIIDDGSKDKSMKVIEKYVLQDSRIRIIRQRNQGVSVARNVGIQNATGKYIIFVDADDELMKQAISQLSERQRRYDVDVVFGVHCYGYGERVLTRIPRVKEGLYRYKDVIDLLIDDGTMTGILFGSVAGNLYKSDFIKQKKIRFEENIRINEDGLFNIDCIRHKAIFFQYTKSPTYLYRQWKNGKKKNYQDMIQAFANCDDVLFNREFSSKDIACIAKQKSWRTVTEIFQISLAVCEALPYIKAKKVLRTLWNKEDIRICKSENIYKMNHFKTFLFSLMGRKDYMFFYLVICYVYPLLKAFVKR